MKVPFFDLKRQYEIISKKVEEKVVKTMRSGQYILGNSVAEFEKKMASYLGVKHVITVANGTDALTIALKALNIKPGDEVITSPFTFFATAEAIASVGATPVFVDICEDTFNIDSEQINRKITNKTKAIIPVHIFGFPCDMEAINKIAKENNISVIEDACQAIGAEYKGKKIGSLGDLACFSFFPTKNLGAFGDGGMITTNNDELATIAKAFREHGGGRLGRDASTLLEGTENNFSVENQDKYYNYLIGYNSRLDAMQAEILNIKLDFLDRFNERRNEIALFYNRNINKTNYILPEKEEGIENIWHQYALRTERKKQLIEFLNEKNISTAAFYPVPLHLQKAFEYLGYKEGDLPVAEKISQETVCLPIFPELQEEELEYMAACLNEFQVEGE